MSQLESLTQFFKDNVPPRAMLGFSSEMDELQYIPAQKDLGLGQYRLAILRSTALLSWERFPYRLCDPRLLMALMTVWLNEADRSLFERNGIDDSSPEWDVSVDDEETATVVLTVPMVEELCIVPDEKGAIPFDGQHWRLADPAIWTALTAQVFGADEQGAPIGQAQ
ncbi:phage tail protein [Hafnia paralvei]|uniref:phage tail protein n=1 Tax=Hafnia paralvei TaxID=546367 RepID=UPI00241CBFCE|nr:phage tail protein [Hafnia paralvei]